MVTAEPIRFRSAKQMQSGLAKPGSLGTMRFMAQAFRTSSYDAVIVGSGPNGLSAGIRLAQAGLSVLVLEGTHQIGGGARSAELTQPGCIHDVCSAIHPLAIGSPFLSTLPLEEHGLRWINPSAFLAHPLDGGRAVILHRDLAQTTLNFVEDAASYGRIFKPLVSNWRQFIPEVLAPVLHVPRRPFLMARFGLRAIRSAAGLARGILRTDSARAAFAGLAAHANLPLDAPGGAAFGLLLGAAGHAVGWPLPRGGAGQITQALAAHLRVLGGEIRTGTMVETIDSLPISKVLLLDLTPLQVLEIAGHELPPAYFRRLERFRYGPGVFKLDYLLSRPVPWLAQECASCPTVHVGGSLDEIATGEAAIAGGKLPEKPFVLLAQPSLFDSTRAPAGQHTLWAYCHVPHGSTDNMTKAVEDQIERFAPGFRDCIIVRQTRNALQMERENPNLIGGDINGGSADLWQLVARPVFNPVPYRTPVPGLYLCSASTPPGGGVHGMCGFHAAEAALRDHFPEAFHRRPAGLKEICE